MKKLAMLLIVSLIPNIALSDDSCKLKDSSAEVAEEQLEIKTDVPSHLKGAKIVVRLADGRETVVPAEKFKVVPRVQQFVVTKTKKTDTLVCKGDVNKNRLSVHAGNGPREGLTTKNHGSFVEVETDVGAVGGLQYQRLVTDKISVSGQVQSNETVLLGVGVDF
jgi:hypothetical protein